MRKVRGPLLDNLHARVKKCGNPACAGKPFTEHRHVPDLRPDPSGRRTDWEQATEKLRAAIACGALVPGDALPSVPELARLQGLRPGTVRHAFLLLAADGLLIIRHGRTTQVAGDAPEISDPAARYRLARSRPGHDCQLSGCRPHVCKPMSKSTIHTIHSILSGAFEAAQRWEWADYNPAESAKPPTVTQKKRQATPPSAVVKVIEQARSTGQTALAPYVWLVAITGVRRGELCAVQVRDIDLDGGVLHVAFNYVVNGGRKVRKGTKTHQDRYVAIDPVTCTLIREHLAAAAAALAGTGVQLTLNAYLFSNQPANTRPWNPDWATHRVADLAAAAGVELNIKAMRHYTAASSWPLGSTWAIPRPGSATPAAARPPCGTTPTRSPRLTGVRPPTSHSSPLLPISERSAPLRPSR